MITIKRSVFIFIIAVSLIIGTLTTGFLTATAQNKYAKKYDYMYMKWSKSFTGDAGEIKYGNEFKKALDEGWRMTMTDGGVVVLERER